MHASRRPLVPFVALLIMGCVGDDPTPTNNGGSSDKDSGTPSETDSVARFIGTWKTTTATQTVGGCVPTQTTKNISVTLSIAQGTKGDIALTNTLAPTCHIEANVVGDVATVIGGQSCISTAGDTYEYLPTSTFRLTNEDGTTAVEDLKANVTSSTGETNCTFAETDPFEKQ